MSYHGDLLQQAWQLARREPRRPRQASLRRAVSAAYYSVFHLLVDEGSRFLVAGTNRERLRLCVSRGFVHRDMKDVAGQFSQNRAPAKIASALAGVVLPPELVRVAGAFVDLQQARHEADYDLSRPFNRQEVLDLVDQAQRAHDDWAVVRRSLPAEAFLIALFALRQIKS